MNIFKKLMWWKKEKELTPSQYFEIVKSRQQDMTPDELNKIYNNAMFLLNKYEVTGQTRAIERLAFHLKTIEKEYKLLDLGVSTYVFEEDVRNYIENIASDVIKIIELKNYPREIPDDIAIKVKELKNIFDEFYVVFTDYTGEVERQVRQDRIDRDPILFGVFKNEETRTLLERFYFIGDWEDDYCTLTLDRMVSEYKQTENKNIEHKIKTPEDVDELLKLLKSGDNHASR